MTTKTGFLDNDRFLLPLNEISLIPKCIKTGSRILNDKTKKFVVLLNVFFRKRDNKHEK